MKITPEYLQQIIQEETNILLFEKRLGRELTTEEVERLRELTGMRGSKRAATKAFEKEMEKIRAGESEEERASADARQKKYDEEGEQSFPGSPTQQPAQDAATPEEPAQQEDEGSSNYPDLDEDSGILILDLIYAISQDGGGREKARKLALAALKRILVVDSELPADSEQSIDDFREFLKNPGGRDRPEKHFDLDAVLKAIQPLSGSDEDGNWGRQGALEVADKLLGDLLRGAANAPPRYKKATEEALRRYEKAQNELHRAGREAETGDKPAQSGAPEDASPEEVEDAVEKVQSKPDEPDPMDPFAADAPQLQLDDAFLDQFIDAHLAPVGLPELGGRRDAAEHEKTMKKARAMAKAKEMSVDASPQAIAKAKAWEKEQEAEKAQWRAEHGFSELPDLPGMSTTPEEAEKLRAAASRTTGLPNLPDPGREERKNVRRPAAKKSSHKLEELLLPLITQVLKENTK